MLPFPDEGSRGQPTHDLGDIQRRVRRGFVGYRADARHSAAELGFFRPDIDECILALMVRDFHKTMPARVPKWAGCWQDVYKPTYRGIQLYVKLQLFPQGRVHVVSFKRKADERTG